MLDGVALPVGAMKVLLNVIKRSHAKTMMGLQDELELASRVILNFANRELGTRSQIPLRSGCELFRRYITRCSLDFPDFTECMKEILNRGEAFASMSLTARNKIAEHGSQFVRDGQTIMTHGYSRVVAKLLVRAAAVERRNFNIVVLEGRPDGGGAKAASLFSEAGIPTTVVLDSAAAHVMERCDLCIVGAEGVLENGGIVNKVGTYALGITAKALGKPFYVAAESYKFARLYPLNQKDLGGTKGLGGGGGKSKAGGLGGFYDTTTEKGEPRRIELGEGVKVEDHPVDFTPAEYISLLFTDLGILTPNAVSDELIRLYQ
ncbi:hypothetical protein TrCOL_g1659 [Triparma columacea]|uniref:Translation initiation factor eIF2B subunit alpha n=1 Tax=Triparma columacea TaxID=722753 RepID=A0A9W7GMH3_9STRA|nr:hypothetical protein TrCOL_g1659 [Triparma columacea]